MEATPYNPALPGNVDVRFSTGAPNNTFNGNKYQPRMSLALALNSEIFPDNKPGASLVGSGNILLANPDGKLDYLLNYNWNGRSITIKYANDYTIAYGSFTTVFKGTVKELILGENEISVVLRDSSELLNKAIQTNTYAGTGGSAGPTDLKNVKKPLLWGRVYSAEPVLVDPVKLIYQFNDGVLTTVHGIYDKGVALTSGGNSANYAALDAISAASIPAGTYRTSTSDGYIRLGAPPDGLLTGDVTGINQTLIGNIVNDIIINKGGLTSGDIDATALSTFNTDNPGEAGYYLRTPESDIDQVIEELVGSVHGYWTINRAGKIVLGQFKFTTPVSTINAKDINDVKKESSPLPNHQVEIGWRRVWAVHEDSDLAFVATLVPKGMYSASTTYSEGDVVSMANGSQYAYINATPSAGNAPPNGTYWLLIRASLPSGESLTPDEYVEDPSVWNISGTNASFQTNALGEGYFEMPSGSDGTISHKVEESIPIDHNAMYEASWELAELGAGATAARFYTVVTCWDDAGNLLTGDGSYWFYPTAYEALNSRNIWYVHTGRFGKGTDRPFPGNATRFGLGVLMNYGNVALNGITRARRIRVRRLSTLEMHSANLNRWTLGDGAAIRNLGVNNWGQSTAYSKASITGPQRFTFRWSGPNTTGTAKMAGLTDSPAPTIYSDCSQAIYYTDTTDEIRIYEASSDVNAYSGITTRNSDEFGIEYDGLYLYPLRNGARMGHSKYVGPNKTYRAFVDSYYIGQGIVQVKHESTNSLSVIGSNTVDINGNPVPLDALRNNMINTDWWKKGATIPWTATGAGTTAIISTPSDVSVDGFKANPEDSMRVTKTGVSGATIGGGWNNGTPSIVAGLNPDKTYRFILPVRHIGGDTQIYWGIDGASVADLNTTTVQTNPYFASSGAGALSTDRWHVFVGFVYPRNSTAKNNDNAGIYDCRTGKKVGSGTNFCFLPGFSSLSHRAFQYYGSADSTTLFGKPVVNLVDGTEPELSTFFEVTSSLEDVSLDWVHTNGQTAQGNTISKVLGSTAAWNAKSITKQSYKSNAFISGRLDAVNTFLGFHELGDTDTNYDSLAYAVHRSGTNWIIYSNGSSVLDMGTSRNGVTFGNLTDFAIFYDNATFKVYADGVSMYEATATPDKTYQGGVAIYQNPGSVSNVRFGPFTENTIVTALPPADIVINADYLGAIISGQFNKVMTPTIKRGGSDFRTNDRMTYTVTNVTGGLVSYVTVNNTTASADKGRVTITNCTATGTYTLNIFFDGVLLNSFVITVPVVAADPPLGGGGGGGTKSGSFSVSGLTVSGTTYVEKGRISGLVKGTGETIKANLPSADYTLAYTSTITRNMVAKWQYSVAGAESWTDFGTGVNGSSCTYIADDFASDTGTITAYQTAAPSNNTYDIRLMCAANAANGTLTFGLSITASVIIEV